MFDQTATVLENQIQYPVQIAPTERKKAEKHGVSPTLSSAEEAIKTSFKMAKAWNWQHKKEICFKDVLHDNCFIFIFIFFNWNHNFYQFPIFIHVCSSDASLRGDSIESGPRSQACSMTQMPSQGLSSKTWLDVTSSNDVIQWCHPMMSSICQIYDASLWTKYTVTRICSVDWDHTRSISSTLHHLVHFWRYGTIPGDERQKNGHRLSHAQHAQTPMGFVPQKKAWLPFGTARCWSLTGACFEQARFSRRYLLLKDLGPEIELKSPF